MSCPIPSFMSRASCTEHKIFSSSLPLLLLHAACYALRCSALLILISASQACLFFQHCGQEINSANNAELKPGSLMQRYNLPPQQAKHKQEHFPRSSLVQQVTLSCRDPIGRAVTGSRQLWLLVTHSAPSVASSPLLFISLDCGAAGASWSSKTNHNNNNELFFFYRDRAIDLEPVPMASAF